MDTQFNLPIDLDDITGKDYPLHRAAQDGDIQTILTLLGGLAYAGVNERCCTGQTAIYYAAEHGHIDVVRELLARGADSSITDNQFNETPLHRAAENGHLNIVELLLANDSDVNIESSAGWTPLHKAARSGRHKVSRFLLLRGADMSKATKKRGHTPLHEAARWGHIDIVSLLLQREDNPNRTVNGGYTPLDCAAIGGNFDVMELLLKRGARAEKANILLKEEVEGIILEEYHDPEGKSITPLQKTLANILLTEINSASNEFWINNIKILFLMLQRSTLSVDDASSFVRQKLGTKVYNDIRSKIENIKTSSHADDKCRASAERLQQKYFFYEKTTINNNQEIDELPQLSLLQIYMDSTLKTDTVEPEKAEPKTLMTEMVETEKSEPKAQNTVIDEPENAEPETLKTDMVETDKAKPEAQIQKTDMVNIEKSETKTQKTEIVEPEKAEPKTLETEMIESEEDEPITLNTDMVEFKEADPEVLKSDMVEQTKAEATALKADMVEAEKYGLKALKIEMVEPEKAVPDVKKTDIVEPEKAEPKATKTGMVEEAEPENQKPEKAEPETKHSEMVEPEIETAEPTALKIKMVEPEKTEALKVEMTDLEKAKHETLEIKNTEVDATEGTASKNVHETITFDESTQLFLTHDWGNDENGISNHSRVSVINSALKELGYKTWFDEERMEGNIQHQMCQGIDKTDVVLVFVTKNYMKKVSGEKEADNCFLEFSYACRRKTASLMLPIVMEEGMKNASSWDGLLGMNLGGTLYVNLAFNFEDKEIFEKKMQELKKQIDIKLTKLNSSYNG